MDFKMNLKIVGWILILIGIALIVFAIMNNYLSSLVIPYLTPQMCTQHCNTLTLENYVLFALIVLSLGVGVYLLFFYKTKAEVEVKEAAREAKPKQSPLNLKSLTPDERKIIEIVNEGGGVLFQSEIVEKTGFPKAKVSRILDRLEAREVVERRRRGMTNAIMIKK
jgi:uncharacterized membrane protein